MADLDYLYYHVSWFLLSYTIVLRMYASVERSRTKQFLISSYHDDVIKWKHFPRYWPFVRGIHRSPHKGQWRGALMFSLICARINSWVNNGKPADLRRHRGHYDVIVMCNSFQSWHAWHGSVSTIVLRASDYVLYSSKIKRQANKIFHRANIDAGI